MTTPQHRFLIIADGDFGPLTSKTANSCIRYFPERIVAVFDRKQAGKTVQEVLGFGGNIPVVADFERGLAQGKGATAVMIGIAPAGGRLPDEWKAWLRTAIERKLEVWSGLHTFVGDDPELAAREDSRRPDPRRTPAAAQSADRRRPSRRGRRARGAGVGSDWQRRQDDRAAAAAGRAGEARASDQLCGDGADGNLHRGLGIAVDAVVADFIAGAAEQLVLQGAKDNDICWWKGRAA